MKNLIISAVVALLAIVSVPITTNYTNAVVQNHYESVQDAITEVDSVIERKERRSGTGYVTCAMNTGHAFVQVDAEAYTKLDVGDSFTLYEYAGKYDATPKSLVIKATPKLKFLEPIRLLPILIFGIAVCATFSNLAKVISKRRREYA